MKTWNFNEKLRTHLLCLDKPKINKLKEKK